MNYTSKQWRMVIRFSDIALAVVVILFVALIAQHYVRFRTFTFPIEAASFLVPFPVLRAIAVNERKKCQKREAKAG